MKSPGSNDLRDADVATRFYDERFRHGYMNRWPREKVDRVAGLIGELGLAPRGRALDFGCGTGTFTRVLVQALPGWDIEGTDVSQVAVESAGRRLPMCRFFPLADLSQHEGAFDLIFTHHVLEHVSDIQETARLLTRVSTPTASMFHILPCGNAGSFEHGVCLLRTDGIRSEPERLFFFEEEGHLRRLDTDSLAALWARDGFALRHAWYSRHTISAINGQTSFGLEDVLAFTAADHAVDGHARRRLRRLRVGLTMLWALRRPLVIVSNKRRFGCRTFRDYALLLGALALYPLGWTIERVTQRLTAREWARRRLDKAGSEMYIHLARS